MEVLRGQQSRCADRRFTPYPRPIALMQKPSDESAVTVPLALAHPPPGAAALYSAASVTLPPQPPLLQMLMSAEKCHQVYKR